MEIGFEKKSAEDALKVIFFKIKKLTVLIMFQHLTLQNANNDLHEAIENLYLEAQEEYEKNVGDQIPETDKKASDNVPVTVI